METTEINEMIDGYVNNKSWRVKENSNFGYSFSGLQSHITNKIIAEHCLRTVYPVHVSDAHRQCWMHLHDLSQGIIGYCAGWSIQDVIMKGFGGVDGKISARPAKHFDSLLGQLMNFTGTLQNEWAGAQAWNNFDTFLAPFVKEDKLSYEQIKQGLQEFVYGVNQSTRWSNQCPFVNLSFDWKIPEDLKKEKCIVGGKELSYTYGDCQLEADLINKAFIEVMTEGDADGRLFTFPIPTYNVTKDFDWESDNAKLLFQMTGKFGLPYFQNFINSNLKPSDVRSMCCRLRISLKELEYKTGGIFGAGSKTGSVGVVTLNLAKMGYVAKSKEELLSLVDKYMIFAKESLEIKREVCEKNMELGLLPYSKVYLCNFKNHFSTIGVCGGHECCLNFLGKGSDSPEGIALLKEILVYMRDKLVVFQQETKHIYNLEATPAEGVSYRFAKHLRDEFGINIKLSGTKDVPFITNSTQLPVDISIDMFDALTKQNELQTIYTGGTVMHMFVGERIWDWRTTKNLVKKIAETTSIPFFSITPTFSVCPEHKYLSGEHKQCPVCNKYCEVYSRVVGYFRPVKNWNEGKSCEFSKRKTFVVS